MVVLGGMAADQWGLVTTAQAKAAGLNGVQLKRLAEAGLVEAVAHGVYLLTAAGQPRHLDTKVAWLRLQPAIPAWQRAAGHPDSGVVSHTSACQLHELGDIPVPSVEISVPRRRTTTDPFVHLRTAPVQAGDITVIDGLPVTTAPKTITDLLRAKADGGHIGGVIADAEQRDLVSIDDLAGKVQPFARSYGLPPATDGRALIEHLVDQAGAHLRTQELELAARRGFSEALQLLAAQQTQHSQAGAATLKSLADFQAQLQKGLQLDMPSVTAALAAAMMPIPQWQVDLREMVRKQTEPLNDALASLAQSVLNNHDLPRYNGAAARMNPETLKAAQSWNAAMAATMRDALTPYAEAQRAPQDAGVGASVKQAAQALQAMRPAIGQADDDEPGPEEEPAPGTD